MKKATGIVRKIDDLGRIVIPKELRKTLSIEEGDSLEIFTNGKEEVILRKYQPGCVLCGSMEHLNQSNDKLVCMECISSFARYAESLKGTAKVR